MAETQNKDFKVDFMEMKWILKEKIKNHLKKSMKTQEQLVYHHHLWAMLTAPSPEMRKEVYVSIKQPVALCSQPLPKCSVAVPPRRARLICGVSKTQKIIS